MEQRRSVLVPGRQLPPLHSVRGLGVSAPAVNMLMAVKKKANSVIAPPSRRPRGISKCAGCQYPGVKRKVAETDSNSTLKGRTDGGHGPLHQGARCTASKLMLVVDGTEVVFFQGCFRT